MSDAVNNSPKERGRPFPKGVSGNVRGRPRGARNRRTRAVLDAAEAGGELPLDYMLRVMRDSKVPNDRRDDMAKSAAPYLHPKLSAVDQRLQMDQEEDGVWARIMRLTAAEASSLPRFNDPNRDVGSDK
jgi:hypothetical protein